jgi:hypothetical protein
MSPIGKKLKKFALITLAVLVSPGATMELVTLIGSGLAFLIGGIVGIVGLFAMVKPPTTIFRRSRWRAASALWACFLLLLFANGERERASTAEANVVAERAAVVALSALRNTDPSRYLAELKRLNDPRYLDELKLLAPAQFAVESDALTQQKFDEVVVRITTLDDRDFDGHIAAYRQLVALAPDRQENAKLLQFWKDRKRIARQRENPAAGLQIVDWSWSRSGFGVVMVANFRVRNENPFSVKDLKFECTLAGNSGTRIGSATQTVYERIEPGHTKLLSHVNIGFINQQSATGGCHIADAVALE